ncbi:MAG: dicarboxylate/amino acid:cation symporter [Synergistaceae bacterium]|nr:dicarboxylate/amino acid:cation symporter [Synergistaceae bacterium]MBQ3759399.1 dicarboxylate/amino acid:cation symporter [Synergistaceae bacterium]MBQ6115482.1 dicarboxylate/amino acid:cation symporter [Synergistaceae bacterium]MBQ6419209.1 dicarboxylate/amino acid:cation symporter [Synergistaceae bacterium]MBQ6664989.1 dicarboxylate/amino acid:cation symporter [Synergistaceae bacterium]
MTQKFQADELSKALEYTSSCLEEMKLSAKDRVRSELMCEEALVSLMNHADFTKRSTFSVNVRKFFGDVVIDFAVPGEEFEFSGGTGIQSLKDDDDLQESYEAIRNIVLRSFSGNIRYKHSGNLNTVRIKAVRSNYSGLYKTLAALFLAVVAGVILRNFAPTNVSIFVNNNILDPIRTVFLNGLKMCAVPIVFFSVVSCIADMGGLSGMKKTGGRLFRYFAASQILGLTVGLCLMYIFRPGEGVNIPVTSGETVQTQSLSFIGMLTNLVAGNVIRPFLDGDMLQIMVLAFFVGLAISLTDAKILRKVSSELNVVFMKITEIFLYLTPLVMFCSAASMIITAGAGTLVSAAGITLTLIFGHVVILVLLCMAVKFRANLNPFMMLRKSAPMLATAFSTCSSIAAIPDSMKCSDAMGISPSLYSFSVPVGVSVSKITTPLFYAVTVLSAANLYGVNITPSAIIQLSVTILLLAVTTPSMPGGGVISLSVLLSQAGCPLEFVGIALSLEMIIDFTATMTICQGNLVCTLLAAADDNLLDREKYNRP